MKKYKAAYDASDAVPIETIRASAMVWRILTLAQLIIIPIAVLVMLVKFFVADTLIQVPEGLEPGYYAAKQIPDRYFVSYAENFVNLAATYQYLTAEAQFNRASDMMVGPGKDSFRREMIDQLLPEIKAEKRSQKFFTNPEFISVERDNEQDKVVLTLRGTMELKSGTQRASYIPATLRVVAGTSPDALSIQQNGIVIEQFQELSP